MKSFKAVLFDFGGVLAEEGFREGLKAIARANGLEPEEFYHFVTEYILSCGYLTGHASEHEFWEGLRKLKGIKGTDEQLRKEILCRFKLRPEMLSMVKGLRSKGLTVGILSDQTNWLDELNEKENFFQYFDFVFNSYHIHRSKKDLRLFKDVTRWLSLKPFEIIFIDDNPENVLRANKAGLYGIVFKNVSCLLNELSHLL